RVRSPTPANTDKPECCLAMLLISSIDVLNGLRRREAVLNDINLHFSYGFPSLSLILSEAPHTETGRLSAKDDQPPLLPRKTIFKSA
ncbi:hypothetical protein ACQCSS_25105, partial [Ralstonia pseudosolanacearum]|uniref:hypothetical protein n=1 Tax=Ralstonia pseudosolanacearum TaxID=1310165 RepID=UPI003CFABF2E